MKRLSILLALGVVFAACGDEPDPSDDDSVAGNDDDSDADHGNHEHE